MYVLDLGCGLGGASRALALPFQDATFDHVWYAVTMNIADKAGLGREVARVLKTGGRFSCNEIEQGAGGAPTFPLPWATNEASSFLVSPAVMRAALEGSGLSILEQFDLTATRLGEKETGRTPVIERDDFPLQVHNLQSCLADGRLLAQFILARGALDAISAPYSMSTGRPDIRAMWVFDHLHYRIWPLPRGAGHASQRIRITANPPPIGDIRREPARFLERRRDREIGVTACVKISAIHS